MTPKQIENKYKIIKVAELAGIDPAWACAIAEVESSYGLNQLSPTKAKGVFQMTSIAVKDLLESMPYNKDDMGDILVGVAFLRLLFDRHKSYEIATGKFCAPKDRHFYVPKVIELMDKWSRE